MNKKIQSLVLSGLILVNTLSSSNLVFANNISIQEDNDLIDDYLEENIEETIQEEEIKYEATSQTEQEENKNEEELNTEVSNPDNVENGWHIAYEDANEVSIDRYVGDSKDIVIPRTLRGKKVRIKGYSYLLPDTVETITVEKENTGSPKIIMEGSGTWGTQIESFRNKQNLTSVKLEGLEIISSNVTGMFENCTALKEVAISDCITYLIQSANSMFKNCSSLVNVELSELDLKYIISMKEMFMGCSKLQSLDLSMLNTEKVTNMQSMFNGCTLLTDLNLSNWDTSNVTNMKWMFENLKINSLDSIKGVETLVRSINPTDLQGMFKGCTGLTNIDVLNNWDTSNVTNMTSMFQGCTGLNNLNGLNNWNTTNVTSMEGIFQGCRSLANINNLTKWDTSNVTTMKEMFQGCTGLTNIDDLDELDINNVNTMESMFAGCSSIKNINLSQLEAQNLDMARHMFLNCTSLKTITIDRLNAPLLRDITKFVMGCTSLIAVKLTNWDVPKLLYTSMFFNACTNLERVNMSNFRAATLDNMRNMFAGLPSLKEVDLTDCELPAVTIMERTFANCPKLTTIKGELNLPSVTNLSQMFNGCTALTNINLNNLNTANLTNTSYMFSDCSLLTDIGGIESFNVSNVTDTSYMFKGCTSLTDLDLSNWDTHSLNNMKAMFLTCTGLTNLNLSGWDTSKVTDMAWMFEDLTLDKIKGIEKWNTSNVTGMQGVFNRCNNLKIIDLSNWTTRDNTDTSQMFDVNNNVTDEQKRVLVITNDKKLKDYDFKRSNRIGCKLKLNANDGQFNTNDTVRYTKERFTIDSAKSEQELLASIVSAIDIDLKKADIPNKVDFVFDSWKIKRDTSYSKDKVKAIYEILNDGYIPVWADSMISVTVPTNSVPFQVVTNLMDKTKEPFICGVLNIKNNSTTRALKVSVQDFQDITTTSNDTNIHKLDLFYPNEYDWENLKGEDTLTKMSLGLYVKAGVVGRPVFTKENPLWLKPNNVSKTDLGIIPQAESDDKPTECKLSFTSKYAKPENFIGGRAKGQFNLILTFE